MLKNFFTVAWRNLTRNKLHSVINITGLAIGISACLVIFLIVRFELSFNKGFKNYERIYRVHSFFSESFGALNRGIPTGVTPVIKEQFTGVEFLAPFHCLSAKVQIPSKQALKEFEIQNDVIITEPSYFSVFQGYEWITGSPEMLAQPFQTILSESKALKYFGVADASVLGKEVIYKDSIRTTVAGVVKDLDFNTDLYFKDFISFSTIEKSWLKKNIPSNDWSSINSSSQLFISATEGTAMAKIQDQFSVLTKLSKEKSSWDNLNNFKLQPMADLHYNGEVGIFDHSRSPASLPTLSIMVMVAFMLLIIGAINFINLVTAQAVRRAKEVGVRKVMGSTKSTLVFQFLAESFMITLAAVLLALPIAELALNYFHEFIPAGVVLNLTEIVPAAVLLVMLVSFMAGLYPAFTLSSYLPAVALKSSSLAGTRNSGSVFLRKSLIVFQFTFAQVLIIATVIVGWQVKFLLSKNLGFRKDAIVYFYTPWHEHHEKTATLKNELTKIAGISQISLSDSPPSENGWSSTTISYKDKEEKKETVYLKFGDTDYIKLYGIKLLAGKNISQSDTVKEVLVNETLMRKLGFSNPRDIIGQQIELSKKMIPIAGVVENFHFQSLHRPVESVLIGNELKDFHCINLQLADSDGTRMKSTLEEIENTFSKVFPDEKIEYQFLDETIRNFYVNEQRTNKLVTTATALAIFISCMGLFGLASYTTLQRTKEIGIRKVLGASSESIVFLLSKEFILLVILAFILAAPVAWMAGNMWLERYAYQIELQAWLFLITAITAIGIALLTVGYQTVKASNGNPIDALRTE